MHSEVVLLNTLFCFFYIEVSSHILQAKTLAALSAGRAETRDKLRCIRERRLVAQRSISSGASYAVADDNEHVHGL